MESLPDRSSSSRIGIAIVQQGEQVVVGVRDLRGVLGGKHEFPGGKCDPEESPADCTIRECLEETGLRVQLIELIEQTHHSYDHGDLDLYFYLCRPVDEVPSSLPGNFHWAEIATLPELNFPSGNRSAIAKLLTRLNRSV